MYRFVFLLVLLYSTLGANTITLENSRLGSPQTEWDINGDGDPSIQGFATSISSVAGDRLSLKVSTSSTLYRIDIYRLGYYQGLGARLVATVRPSVRLPQIQPKCLLEKDTWHYDCGNWAVSATWDIPLDSVSGLYIARLIREDDVGVGWRADASTVSFDRLHVRSNQSLSAIEARPLPLPHCYGAQGMGKLRNSLVEPRASHVYFVVRSTSFSDLLFQTSDTTWYAYNGYGGYTTYGSFKYPYSHGPDAELDPSIHSSGLGSRRAYKSSYNRPLATRGYRAVNAPLHAEYPMIRFLERNGYDVAYMTGVDAAQRGEMILNTSVFMSVGHDEYWSGSQRQHVAKARDSGVHLAFFSGNEVYWKIRWEDDFKTLVVYKETQSNAKIDPDSKTWTGTWRDSRDINPEGGFPENELTGTLFMVNAQVLDSIRVPSMYRKLRFWRNTSISDMAETDTPRVLLKGSLGHEFDEDLDNGYRPAGLIHLSESIIDNVPYLQDHGTVFDSGTATHHLVMYRHPVSRALVFGAGTVQWAWGLDENHDWDDPNRRNKYNIRIQVDYSGPDRDIQQATVNLFADMGVQPHSIAEELIFQYPSNDNSAPACFIDNWFFEGSSIHIEGRATDTQGQIAGVEISIDGGELWHPAVLLSSKGEWAFVWGNQPWHRFYDNPATPVLQCRATDDSLNIGKVTKIFRRKDEL